MDEVRLSAAPRFGGAPAESTVRGRRRGDAADGGSFAGRVCWTESAKVRKCGSAGVRECGSAGVRECGSAGGRRARGQAKTGAGARGMDSARARAVAVRRGALSPGRLFARSSRRRPTPPPTSGEGLCWAEFRTRIAVRAGAGVRVCAGRRSGAVLPSPRGRLRGEGRCVRDARPQGREPGAGGTAVSCRLRRGLGAVGNSCIVAYGARSPARSAAEGHAQVRQCRVVSAKCQVLKKIDQLT